MEERSDVSSEETNHMHLIALRQEAAKLTAPGVRFVLHLTDIQEGADRGLGPAPCEFDHSEGLLRIQAPAAEADLYVIRPVLTQGYIELCGYAQRRGGKNVKMRLQLLLGHAGCVHGYLYYSREHAANASVSGELGVVSDANGGDLSVEVRGAWSTRGQLKIFVMGDCSGDAADVVYGGAVYSGLMMHEKGESSVRGVFGGSDVAGSSDMSSDSAGGGEFLWQLRERSQQLRQLAGGTALRTSAMAFLESHYKQRCELKLRGARVKRRSLLQRMKDPRTFQCLFRGIEADGSDRRAVVTVGTSADEAQNQGTGFFLYQHWRLMAACVPVDVQVTRQDSSDTLEDSAFLGVVDMGAAPLAVPQQEAGVGGDIGFVGLEWMKELDKWRVVVRELKRVLAEYAGHTDLAVGGDGVQVGGSADDSSGTLAVSSGSAVVMQEKTGAVEIEAAVRNSADTSSATAAVSSGSAAVMQEKTGAVEVEAAVRKARTALDNTADDIQEARDGGGDDAEEDGESEDEDEHGEGEGTKKPKRRQARSFYFTTEAVKRIESKEGTSLTAMCQVGGHADCNKSIPMPNGGTQGVQQHFLKCHTALNAKIRALRALKLTAATVKKPPNFLMLLADASSGTLAVSSGSAAAMQDTTAVEVEVAGRDNTDAPSATVTMSCGSAAVMQETTGAEGVEVAVGNGSKMGKPVGGRKWVDGKWVKIGNTTGRDVVEETEAGGEGEDSSNLEVKSKPVEKSRCRIFVKGTKMRCQNAAMEGGGGLCSFHKSRGAKVLPGNQPGDAGYNTNSNTNTQLQPRGVVPTLASMREPRRIIKSSRLADGDESDGEAQTSRRLPPAQWVEGDKAWIMDVAGVGCPIAGLAAAKARANPAEGGEGEHGGLLEGVGSCMEVDDTSGNDAHNLQGEVSGVEEQALVGERVFLKDTGEEMGESVDMDGKGEARAEDAGTNEGEMETKAKTEGGPECMAEDELDDGGLPSVNDVDLSLLGREKQSDGNKPLAHKNVAITKVILTAELAAEIYRALPDDKSEYKPRSIEVSSRYGVAPKTIRDVWDRKTWSKATVHLFIQRTGKFPNGVAPTNAPQPSPEVLLGTLISGRLASGKFLVKLDQDSEQIECYLANLSRFHPISQEPADPAWAEAEEIRRAAAAEEATASRVVLNAGARKRGRRLPSQAAAAADGKSVSQGAGVSQGGTRPQRHTLEGRCRTVITRLLRSQTTISLGEMQEVMKEEDPKGAGQWLALDELHQVGERADRSEFTTFFDFWECVLNVWRTLVCLFDAGSPMDSHVKDVVEEFDRIFEDTFADELARLRGALVEEDETVDGMDFFGLRVCVYNTREHRLQYGMVDDADESSVHVMYDDEQEGWVTLPSKELMILRPDEEDPPPKTSDAYKAEPAEEKKKESTQEKKQDSAPVADAAASGNGWKEWSTPDGRKYYHNAVKNITQWARPAEMDEPPAPRESQAFTALAVHRLVSVKGDVQASVGGGTTIVHSSRAATHDSLLRLPQDSASVSRVVAKPKAVEGELLKAHVKLPEHVFQLGIQVEVLYDDGTWYLGRITQYNQETAQHRIVFDDGDWQEISLPDPDVRLACLTSHGERPPKMKIQEHGTENGAISQFKNGDMVWWRYTKGEWWPARVTSLQQVKSKQMRSELEEMGVPDDDSVLVHTFGDRTYAWVDLPPADLRGFGLHAELLSQRVSDRSNFERSIKEALFLWQRQSAQNRQIQNARYLVLEEAGPVVSNVEVEYLVPKLDPVENASPIQSPKAAGGRAPFRDAHEKLVAITAAAAAAAAAKEAAADAAAAMKMGRIANQSGAHSIRRHTSAGGGVATGGQGTEIGGLDAAGAEVGKKRGRLVPLADEEEELSVGGWRIAQAIEAERMRKEVEAREHRLAVIFSRMSHQELLTALTLLGVALTRDQAMRISKLVAAKLSALGVGRKAVVTLKQKPFPDSPPSPSPSPAELQGRPIADAVIKGPESPPPGQTTHGVQSPPPPPPVPALLTASVAHDPHHDDVRGGGSGLVDNASAPQETEGAKEEYMGVTEVEAGWSANIAVEDVRLHLGTFSTALEAAMAYDVAVRFYLGEDAACNFATEQVEEDSLGDIITLEWWESSKRQAADDSSYESRCDVEMMNATVGTSSHEAHERAVIKVEPDGDTATLLQKRQRGGGIDKEHVDVAPARFKKPKLLPFLDEQVQGGVRIDRENAEEEWGECQWIAFRKRLARETAAADATESSLRHSKARSRQITEELKRREETFRDTLRRWARDQQALARWQGKMETMLLAIEHVQANS